MQKNPFYIFFNARILFDFSFIHKLRKIFFKFGYLLLNTAIAISVYNILITGKRWKWDFLI